jgi:maleamate amidohydrolase
VQLGTQWCEHDSAHGLNLIRFADATHVKPEVTRQRDLIHPTQILHASQDDADVQSARKIMKNESIYAKQTFGQKTGFGRNSALLVVDFVNGFVDPGIFGGGNVSDAVEATVPLLDFFRSQQRPVIFTRIVYADDGSDAGVWCQKVPRLRELTEASPASQVVPELAPQTGEIIIRKTQASAFFGTGLSATLIGKSIDTLVIAGATTSGCVRASVTDAMSWNFRPIVAKDCVGDRALGPHEANLFDMGQKYADLMTAREIIATLSVQD